MIDTSNREDFKNLVNILYEDEHLLAIDKPYGLVVNRSLTQKDNLTLQDWVESFVKFKFTKEDGDIDEFVDRSGIVHRLDKDTTGILLIAKSPSVFKKLQKQFKRREVKKKYIALVYGILGDGIIGEEIIVDAPIARNPDRRDKFAITEDGRLAKTHFILKKIFSVQDVLQQISTRDRLLIGNLSLVECIPITGRTHQIRVHLTALGNPVVGDMLYSGKKRSKEFNKFFERQFLHSTEIVFDHPILNKPIIVSANLPEDIAKMIN